MNSTARLLFHRQRNAFAALLVATLLYLPDAALGLSERDILVRFYHLSGGSHWKKADGWREAAESSEDSSVKQIPLCSWHGVYCRSGTDSESDHEVELIDLSLNHLSGKVSKHLWSLPHLVSANFRGNLLHDAGLEGFDEGNSIRAPLKMLDLTENRLTSLKGIESVPTTLEELHLSSNALDGPFPHEVFRLKKLKVLRATYNHGITGTLPTEVGQLTHLRELEFSYNSFTGKIPSELGLLTQAEFVSLDDNKFEGRLPPELQNMVNLQYLSINNERNNSGYITGNLHSFPDCTNLKELYLNGNGLSGTIPADLLANSEVLDKEVTISLEYNDMRGKIPEDLTRFEKLNLELKGNKFTNISNKVCNKKKWMKGMVAEYGCAAILCPEGTSNVFGREVRNHPCIPCPNGELDAPHLGSFNCRSSDNNTNDGGANSNNKPVTPGDEKDLTLENGDVSGNKAKSVGSASTIQGNNQKALGGAAKFFIVLLCLLTIYFILVAYRRRRAQRERIEMNIVMNNIAPNKDDSVFDSQRSDPWNGSFTARRSRRNVGDTSIIEDLEEVEIGVVRKGDDGVDRCIL